MKPPLVAVWILRLTVPASMRPDVLGDLEERYGEVRSSRGRRAAHVWYWRQAITVPFWLHGDGLRIKSTERGLSMRGNDVLHAARSFLRAPGFTVSTVVTLALGIGAAASVFSVVNGVLIKPLPFDSPDRLVSVWHTAPGLNAPRLGSATGLHHFYTEQARSLERGAAFRPTQVNLSGGDTPRRVAALQASPSLFPVLRTQPHLGRLFRDEEGRPGASRVTILSHRLWTTDFGADPAIVGRTVEIEGRTIEVVGVMPAGFAFPTPDVSLYLPLRSDPMDFGGFNVLSIARLDDEVTVEAAQGELSQLLPRMPDRFGEITPEMLQSTGLGVVVEPYAASLVGDIRAALLILLGTVGFVLLIACANVANLFLVRAEGRSREIAVRTALGASRGALVGHFLVESVLLVSTGSVIGLILTWLAVRSMQAVGSVNVPRLNEVSVDLTVVGFVVALTLVVAVMFALVPLLKHKESGASGTLRESGRGATVSKAVGRVRSMLVAGQIALALILLTGSGLMLKSLKQLRSVDPGFDSESVITFEASLPGANYSDNDSRVAFHEELLTRFQALPGVEVVGAANYLPLAERTSAEPLFVEGKHTDPNVIPDLANVNTVTPDYFSALDIPLIRGRLLDAADYRTASGAVVISETIASRFWDPNEDPIGARISQSGLEETIYSTVVGIVGDVHASSLIDEPTGMVYYAMRPAEGAPHGWMTGNMAYAIRTAGIAPTSLVPQIRTTLRALDPTIPLARVRTMVDILAEAESRMRFAVSMLLLAAIIGATLGGIGIYGVVSYVTAQRTKEIGVRMAMGAAAGTVRAMIVKQAAWVALSGIAVGLMGAFLLTRFLESLLYEVSATDPVTYLMVTAGLFALALLASYVPAARAAGIDPQNALREEA